MEVVDIYLVPPLQGGKTGAGFHKPRVRTLGWFVKALQAYIDTVKAVRVPHLPTTLHSYLIKSESPISRINNPQLPAYLVNNLQCYQ